MTDIVNLRLARKAKARKASEDKATAQRLKFGETGAARRLRQSLDDKRSRRLDGHRLEKGDAS